MRVFVLATRFPYPLEKGDKLRLFRQIQALSAHCEVILCALSEHPIPPTDLQVVAAYCRDVHVLPLSRWRIGWGLLRGLLTQTPLQVAYYKHPQLQRQVQRLIAKYQPHQVYCQMVRSAPYAANCGVPNTLDYMDALSANMRRTAATASRWLRPLYLREARLLQAYEQQQAPLFRHRTVISAQDADLLNLPAQYRPTIVPNGIDTQYFAAPSQQLPITHQIVFVGNMGYAPNVAAAQYLVQQVLPLLPTDTRVLIAGARPSLAVRRLSSAQVTVTGWLDDVRTAYTAGAVFVAPLFTGSGQQNKLLEAMALERPCVTTPLVNNAIGATHGQSILLADKPDTFAAHIRYLLEHPEQAQRIGQQGRRWVEHCYRWETTARTLLDLWQQPKP